MIDYFPRSNIPFAALAYVKPATKPDTLFQSNVLANNPPKSGPKPVGEFPLDAVYQVLICVDYSFDN